MRKSSVGSNTQRASLLNIRALIKPGWSIESLLSTAHCRIECNCTNEYPAPNAAFAPVAFLLHLNVYGKRVIHCTSSLPRIFFNRTTKLSSGSAHPFGLAYRPGRKSVTTVNNCNGSAAEGLPAGGGELNLPQRIQKTQRGIRCVCYFFGSF
jgi:hypothetical protein